MRAIRISYVARRGKGMEFGSRKDCCKKATSRGFMALAHWKVLERGGLLAAKAKPKSRVTGIGSKRLSTFMHDTTTTTTSWHL